MISAAQLALDQAAAGQTPTVEAVPAWQWVLRFDELQKICPSQFGETAEKLGPQKNALRVELVHFSASSQRCKLQSPDGRGLIWYLSGGSPLSYGKCCASQCPRTKVVPL